MTTLTPWFPVDTPPVRSGWYEFKIQTVSQLRGQIIYLPNEFIRRYYWTGHQWVRSPQAYFNIRTFPDDQWRGLAQPPERL